MCKIFSHKWDYMTPEYRRCTVCGKLQEYIFLFFWRDWNRSIDEWKNAVQWAKEYHLKNEISIVDSLTKNGEKK